MSPTRSLAQPDARSCYPAGTRRTIIGKEGNMAGNVSPDWNTRGECGWCRGVTAKAPQCWCAHCHDEFVQSLGGFEVLGANAFSFHHMYLCPDCGNKRCPRASNHELKCTGSNKPGQTGSRY